MILQVNDVNFEILDVLKFQRESTKFKTTKRNFWVLSCRLNGQSTFYCNGEEFTADPQHYMLMPPELQYAQEGGKEEVLCVHLKADCPVIHEFRSIYLPSPTVRQQFIDLYENWQRKEFGYMLRCKSIIYGMLGELARRSMTGETRVLTPATDYILAHFNEPTFSLAYAIDAAAVSPAYFRRLFKECYKKTPTEWVNELRIDYAKTLLKSHRYSMAQIAHMSGFEDEKYFYTVFKKIIGSSPAKWAKG